MKKLIWVIDDFPAVSESIAALLITEHLPSIAIYSGDEVEKRLNDGEIPKCMILDILMQHGDGNKIIQRVMQNPQYVFPIIVITGDEKNLNKAVIGRVSTILTKPVEPVQLLIEVKHLLRYDS